MNSLQQSSLRVWINTNKKIMEPFTVNQIQEELEFTFKNTDVCSSLVQKGILSCQEMNGTKVYWRPNTKVFTDSIKRKPQSTPTSSRSIKIGKTLGKFKSPLVSSKHTSILTTPMKSTKSRIDFKTPLPKPKTLSSLNTPFKSPVPSCQSKSKSEAIKYPDELSLLQAELEKYQKELLALQNKQKRFNLYIRYSETNEPKKLKSLTSKWKLVSREVVIALQNSLKSENDYNWTESESHCTLKDICNIFHIDVSVLGEYDFVSDEFHV